MELQVVAEMVTEEQKDKMIELLTKFRRASQGYDINIIMNVYMREIVVPAIFCENCEEVFEDMIKSMRHMFYEAAIAEGKLKKAPDFM